MSENIADNLYLSEGKRKNIVQRSREEVTYKRCLSATTKKPKVELESNLLKLSKSKRPREEVERVQSERWL